MYKNRGKGGKLNRSEVVTIRLDPRLRYLAELASRQQRRTMSSFIESAIERSLGNVYIDERKTASLAKAAAELWDVNGADRFVQLATRHPNLLTHEEEVLWKLLRNTAALRTMEDGRLVVNLPLLRQHWSEIVDLFQGTDADNYKRDLERMEAFFKKATSPPPPES